MQKILINVAVASLAVLVALFIHDRLKSSGATGGGAGAEKSEKLGDSAPAHIATSTELVNLLDNSGFDTGIEGWTAVPGSTMKFISNDDAEHKSDSGSLEISARSTTGNPSAFALSKCFPVVGSAPFAFGAHTKVGKDEMNGNVIFNCGAFSDSKCSRVVSEILTSIPSYSGTEWRDMGPLTGTGVLPARAQWAKCALSANAGLGKNAISARMDDAYFKSLRPN